MAVWPGDTAYSVEQILALADGDSVNLTTLHLSAHSGSHVDAPSHFDARGITMAEVDLDIYWGLAQVVTVARNRGALVPADFAGVDLSRAPRLLVHSPASHVDPAVFPREYVYPDATLAPYLAEHGVRLFGTDAPSMDAINSKSLPGHHALQEHGIAILEWLDLSKASDGLYELVALPLRIVGGDGSPVRAALRPATGSPR
jgi:arylformamidase